MNERIAEMGVMKHVQAIEFFNDLIIDLKLLQLGKLPRQPITMERLEDATRHLVDLERCKEKVVWR